jgi:hypothetical protein
MIGKKPQVSLSTALVDGRVRREHHEDYYGPEDLR